MKFLHASSRLLFGVVCIFLLLGFLLTWIGVGRLNTHQEASLQSEITHISQLQNHALKSRYFSGWERIAQADELEFDSLRKAPNLDYVIVLTSNDAEGKPWYTTHSDTGLLVPLHSALLIHQRFQNAEGSIWIETVKDKPYLCLAKQLTRDGMQTHGIVVFTLPLDTFLSQMADDSGLVRQVALLTADTVLYGRTGSACLNHEIGFASLKNQSWGLFTCAEKQESRYAWSKQPLFGSVAMLYVQDAPVQPSPAKNFLLLVIFMLAAGMLLVPLYFKRKYYRQIGQISQVVHQIRDKNFDCTLPTGLTDEMSDLANAIDGMRQNLKEIYHDLEIRVIRRTSEISMRNAELRKTHRDILKQNTELQSAYDALKESREKYEKLIQHLENEYFFYSKALNGTLLFVSKSVHKILGYHSNDYRNRHQTLYTRNPLNEEARNQQSVILKEARPVEYLAEVTDAGGQEKVLEVVEVPVFNDDHVLVSIEGMARDITEKQKNEELIKEQEEQYRMLFNHASDFIFLYELNTRENKVGKFIEANQYTLQRLNYSMDELRQITPLDLIAVDIWRSDIQNLEEFTLSKEKFERIWESKEGKIINLEISTHVFNIKNRDVVIAVARDITDRKRAEEEIRFVNEELVNQKENLEALVDNLTQTQEQLVQSEKMAALGQLIAGIAHEINTPLGAIKASIGNLSDSLDTALRELPELTQNQSPLDMKVFSELFDKALVKKPELSSREKRQIRRDTSQLLGRHHIAEPDLLADTLVYLGIYQDNLETLLPQFQELDNPLKVVRSARNFISLMKNSGTINVAVEKATKVVFALKKYAHRDAMGEKASADIIDGIETVLTLYNNQLKQGIEVTRDYDELPLVNCFKDEISQVWTNLLQNAIQAMRLEGTLLISAKLNGDSVVVSFKDSGPGIDPEIQERIFEPFFTTKKAGEGSGLGLDIVKKIVEKHDGSIWLESELGKGATFHVKIPLE